MENERRDGLRDRLNAAGHGYLFRWFDSLSSDEERSAYLDHLLEMVDLGELERMKLSASSCKSLRSFPLLRRWSLILLTERNRSLPTSRSFSARYSTARADHRYAFWGREAATLGHWSG